MFANFTLMGLILFFIFSFNKRQSAQISGVKILFYIGEENMLNPFLTLNEETPSLRSISAVTKTSNPPNSSAAIVNRLIVFSFILFQRTVRCHTQ